MAYSVKVGSFNLDSTKTATQTIAITGVGFQPKIVLFWWGGSTGTGDSVAGGDIRYGFGAAISSSSRFAVSAISLDNLDTSDSYSKQDNTECIRIYTNTSIVDGIMDFSSMDADGFTLVVDDQFSANYRISYLALGGTDLTNVYIGNKAMPTSAGNYSTTGVGFQPDLLITVSNQTQTVAGSSADIVFSLGMATGSSNQGVVYGHTSDNSGTSFTKGYGYNGETNSFATIGRESFVSFDADGFTLNHLEGASPYVYHFICLKGGQYKVHELTTRTDGNDIVENDVGFQPVALLFASANRALSTQDARTDNNRISIGAATSASERANMAISDEANLGTTETAYANYDSAVYAFVQDDAIVGLMDIKSIDAGGFTAVMDDSDPSGCWVCYLAIGAAAGTVYTQSIAGAITPSGTLAGAACKVLAGALTFLGELSAQLIGGGTTYTQSVSGELTSAGAVVKRAAVTLAGSLTPANLATFYKGAVVSLSGELTSAGAVVKRAAVTLTGGLTPSGAAAGLKIMFISLAGALTSSGTLVKRGGKSLDGSLTSAGTVIKQTARAISGELTSAGAVIKRTAKALDGALTPDGIIATVKNATSTVYYQVLSGAIIPTGNVVRSAAKTFAGTLLSSGLITVLKSAIAIGSKKRTLATYEEKRVNVPEETNYDIAS